MKIDSNKIMVITEQLTKLSIIFPRSITVNEAVVMIWYEALEDFSSYKIKLAFKAVINSCKAFPTPAGVVDEISKIRGEGEPPTNDQAWIEANSKCSMLSYGSPKPEYSHPAIAKTVQELGGAMRFAECQEKDLHFLKLKFIGIYKEVLRSGKYDTEPVLIGKTNYWLDSSKKNNDKT